MTDGAGNQNWAEIRFQISSQDQKTNGISQKRLAVVNPLFTDGAYNFGGFYDGFDIQKIVIDFDKNVNYVQSLIYDRL